MANPEQGETTVEIDGQTYTIKVGMRALREFQEMFSSEDRFADLQTLLDHAQRGRVRNMLALFWAGLQAHHPSVTFERATELFDLAGEQKVKTLLRAIGLFVSPDPRDVEELGVVQTTGENPPKAQAEPDGTGENSTSVLVASV